MSPNLIVDIIIVLIVIAALVGGWRQGVLSSVFSTIGVLAGLVCGVGLAPLLMQLTDTVPLRFLLAIGSIVLFVAVGNLVGGIIGAALRNRMRMRATLKVDSFIGSIFQAFAALIVVWLVAIPLATGLPEEAGKALQTSKILGAIDRIAPPGAHQVPSKISAMLNDSGLPPMISPFYAATAPEVAAPNIEVEDQELVEQMQPSVIHVVGTAPSCRRQLMGSGFVTAEDYVVTNAHVVAGTESVSLDTVNGLRDATVVYYNPQLDIAILHSPGLGLPVLPWEDDAAVTGQDAIVMGFPESGPFEASPARVRSEMTLAGPDIYAAGRVERQTYTVRGSIREGNSGGPMTDTNGEVLGVVFGASIDDTDTGYVLTAGEVRQQIGDVTQYVAPVSTQECVAK